MLSFALGLGRMPSLQARLHADLRLWCLRLSAVVFGDFFLYVLKLFLNMTLFIFFSKLTLLTVSIRMAR